MILNHKLGRRLLSTLKVDTVHQGHVEFLHLCAGRSRVLVFTPGVGGGGGWGSPHMKGLGMLVVSLRGVNFGFGSHLGCSGQNAIIFSREGLV